MFRKAQPDTVVPQFEMQQIGEGFTLPEPQQSDMPYVGGGFFIEKYPDPDTDLQQLDRAPVDDGYAVPGPSKSQMPQVGKGFVIEQRPDPRLFEDPTIVRHLTRIRDEAGHEREKLIRNAAGVAISLGAAAVINEIAHGAIDFYHPLWFVPELMLFAVFADAGGHGMKSALELIRLRRLRPDTPLDRIIKL